MLVALAAVEYSGMVSAESFGDLAATADQMGGVSAHMTDTENVAPRKGRQHLPPESSKLRNSSIGDPDGAAMPVEQPEEARGYQGSRRRYRRGALRAGPSTFSLRRQGRGLSQHAAEGFWCCYS